MAMLDRVRQDLKILANSLLGGIPEVREQLILVNPFETPKAQHENRAPLRAALGWLAGGGLLQSFPPAKWRTWTGKSNPSPIRGGRPVPPGWHCTPAAPWSRHFSKAPTAFPSRSRGSCTPGCEPWHWPGSSAKCGAGPSACGSARPSVTTCWRGTGTPSRPPPTCGRVLSFYRIDPSPRLRPSRHSPCRGSGRSHRRERSGSFRGRCLPSRRNANWRTTNITPCISLALHKFPGCWRKSAAAASWLSARWGKAPGSTPTSTGSTSTIGISSSGIRRIAVSPAHTAWPSPATCCRDSGSPACTPAPCSDSILASSSVSVPPSNWGGRSWCRSIKRTTPRCCSSGRGSYAWSRAGPKRRCCLAP